MARWKLADALDHAWDQLRVLPIASSSHVAQPWLSVLNAIAVVRKTLDDASPLACLDAELKALSTDILLLYLAGDEAVRESVNQVRLGFNDAGTDVNDW